MKVIDRSTLLLLALGIAGVQSCGGGGGGGSGGGSSQFSIVEVSNGFGRLLPHQVQLLTNGVPGRLIDITSEADLIANVRADNPIRPPTQWPTTAILPSTPNIAGNHFIYVRFSQPIAIDTVLDRSVNSSSTFGLKGAIQVQQYDPVNGSTTLLSGRGFVGGKTYGPTDDGFGSFVLEQWVQLDANGLLVANLPDAVGFPGTQGGFAGDDVLADPNTFVYVYDTDGDLSTHETFRTGVQIQMKINEDVMSSSGKSLDAVGLASSTVGPDTVPPEIGVAAGSPKIVPSRGAIDVDPETNIEIEFTEPIQILTIAGLDDGTPPALSSAIQIEFGPLSARVQVPYVVRPFSVFDLSRVALVPAYNFPGIGPQLGDLSCGTFGQVTVRVLAQQFRDLAAMQNTSGITNHSFTTAEGAGLVNAPVVPEAIYVGRGGANPGISVIDMNGFGGGTGNPTFDTQQLIKEGNSNFPNNPNVALVGAGLTPPLVPGTCTLNGGSEGVFTLTKDSSLRDLLVTSPLIESVGDMAIGHALDLAFNNSAPFGCQSGGGNICAVTGLKRVVLSSGGANSLAPATTSALGIKTVSGGENLASWAPSPNPPPIVFPPLCLSPLILAQEPTSGLSLLVSPNLLVPGSNSRGNPGINRPPSNLMAGSQNAFFNGPSTQQPTVTACINYVMRQQVGQFLYVVDRVAGEIVVLNSNRFTVVDRIPTPDPTSLAMSPNLDLLAVTNEGADQVSFIDTDPSSSSFHQVVRTVRVGAGPTGIAWEPGNEDIFVCNQSDGSVTVLSAFSLQPRKTLRNQLTRPIDVALTPRQLGFGFLRGVYFAYILNQDGTCAVFESGPDGVNGWGFDDTIGSLPFRFLRPKAIQPDMIGLNSAVWIAHEGPLNANGDPTGEVGGALSQVGIASGTRGIQFFIAGPIANPQIRNLGFGVLSSVGEGSNGLSGIPVDLAFDNMLNSSALTNYSTQFSAGQPLSINGKASVRLANGLFGAVSAPAFLFAAIPNPGVIDVLELDTGTLQKVDTNVFRPGIQSIPAQNVTSVVDYFRQ